MQHLKTDLGRSPNDHESSPSADAGSAPWTLDQTAAQDEPPRNPSPPGQLRELLGGSGKWAQCPPKHGGAPSMPGFITPNWDVLTGREGARAQDAWPPTGFGKTSHRVLRFPGGSVDPSLVRGRLPECHCVAMTQIEILLEPGDQFACLHVWALHAGLCS